MSTNWRISSINGVLLAAYFIPTWTMIAFRMMVSPIHSFYEAPNIAVAFFVSDHLHLAATGTVRAAWLLALGRLTMAAFFAIFAVFLARPSIRKSGGADEALGIALGIGSLISFVSMVMAAQVGEIAARQLHATELLMLLGTAIVMLVEPPLGQGTADQKVAAQNAAASRSTLEQSQLLNNG
jgi:hypothetical protein